MIVNRLRRVLFMTDSVGKIPNKAMQAEGIRPQLFPLNGRRVEDEKDDLPHK